MTAALVLAAGAGTRFGGPKQLATFDGEPLVARACRVAVEAGLSPVLLVLGAHAREIAPRAVRPEITVVVHAGWARGLGSSIGVGAARIADDADLALMLADQPLVGAAHIAALARLRRRQRADVAATAYDGHRGVPAVFAARMLPELRALDGHRGAAGIIAGAARVVTLACPAAAIDIDRPEDLVRLSRIAACARLL